MELTIKKVRDGYKVARDGKLIPGQMPYPTPAGAESAILRLQKQGNGLGVTRGRRVRGRVRTARSAHFKRRNPEAFRVRDVSTESLKFGVAPMVSVGDRGRRCFSTFVTTANDLNIGNVEACTWEGNVKEADAPDFLRSRSVRDMKISSSGVDQNFQGRGIGTRLYEMALKESCVRGYDGLQSDRSLSKFSGSFWRKQHAKGRAELMVDEDAEKLFRIDCRNRPETLEELVPLDQTDDEGRCVSKAQALRVADVFLIGPAMVATGAMESELPKELRAAIIWMGVGTIFFNGVNWFRFLPGSGPL
jgi:ribosomal protein S18 acetylase RimI-like enzyme